MRFKKVYIEITNICNLQCDFCPKVKREAKLMKAESFTHVIEEIKPYTNYVYFHLMGEPFLHPELGSFLEICHLHGLKVNITTNGTLLTKVKDILIGAPALRKLSFSLHSFEANDQAVNFREYISNIVKFVAQATEKTSIICELRLWNLDGEAVKGSNTLNTEILQYLESEFGLDYSLRDKFQETRRVKLANNTYLEVAEKFEWPGLKRDIIDERGFCYGLRDQIGILVDGTVVPCCLDNEGNIPLGNIYLTPLAEILKSPRVSTLYDGFSKRCAVEELCKRCEYAQRYK